jgi:hypothetical protein
MKQTAEMRTKFHKDWFRYGKVKMTTQTDSKVISKA